MGLIEELINLIENEFPECVMFMHMNDSGWNNGILFIWDYCDRGEAYKEVKELRVKTRNGGTIYMAAVNR